MAAISELRDALEQSALEHRVRAFIYTWLWLIEPPVKDARLVLDLLDEHIAMRLSDGRTITTRADITAWYEQTAGAVSASSHRITALHVRAGDAGTVYASIDFAWQGIGPGDQAMTARTHHEWTLVDTGGPLMKLRDFAVTALKPFAPSSIDAALAEVGH
ncbi:hypothetical protein [Nocardia arthritidis]|uniref:SnoaL-like domain-containing protein n=1 Tax=Nocardia arthritidis TaxID=228602 RepID=A0A6G9YQK7_9NOCA|nr:hypothetical protein [Nocardia arthritidis]QIS15461.1 hypothetical protein F5544_38180 [Nocardia arthritidis]